ncbi:regulation of nuclear pre-mRNA domain-containing protein 1B-like [Dysidea avara]|uniref:regulation of nuclear pre-mRNA domain-containing protein 1B-like n=1 Tax=Dysidea avara TaxID=196820 RepID=UPI00333002DC
MSSGSSHFSSSGLAKKLRDLTTSQQSVQSLSNWLIHYRKHAKIALEVWQREFNKANNERKVTLLYLANDVVQNSKRKGPEYRREFTIIMPDIFKGLDFGDASIKRTVTRILSVWEERNVFSPELRQALRNLVEPPPQADTNPLADEASAAKRSKLDLSPPATPPVRPAPEAAELMKRLMTLQKDQPSQDMKTHQQVTSFPPEVYNSTLLSSIKDKASMERLNSQVESTSRALGDYVTKLDKELKERKEVQELLESFTYQQKQQLKETKLNLEEYKGKLQRVKLMREELKSHLASLPDLSRLPVATGGLAPLPTAGELFR